MLADPRLVFDPAGHTYAFEGKPLLNVTGVLAAAGLVDARWYTEESRMRGTYVHQAIELHHAGDLSTLDPALQPYFAAYLDWRRASGFDVHHCEVRVCDPALGFAGTADLIGVLPDRHLRPVLVDVKTGTLPPTVGPQTAAYALALRLADPMYVAMRRFALHLRGDGTYRFEPLTNARDESTFLAALTIATFQRDHQIAGFRSQPCPK